MNLFNKKFFLCLAYQQINLTVYDTVVANLTILKIYLLNHYQKLYRLRYSLYNSV